MIVDDDLYDCCICEANYESLFVDYIRGQYQVVCKNCTTSTSKLYPTKEIAIKKWNTMCKFYKKTS